MSHITTSLVRGIRMGLGFVNFNMQADAAAPSMIMDGDTEKLVFKYYPSSHSPIKKITLGLRKSGTVSDTQFKIQVEGDNADAPSGAVLGASNNAITPAFNGPSASPTMLGPYTFTENTGDLTVNAPVWLVLFRSGGGSLSPTDYVYFHRGTNNGAGLGMCDRLRHFDGTDWTTTPVQTTYPLFFVIEHEDGVKVGVPNLPAITASILAPAIYGANKQGWKFKAGSQISITTIITQLQKTGAPADLNVAVFEGAVEKYSTIVPASAVISGQWMPVFFPEPVLLAPDTVLSIVMSQVGAGGSAANNYKQMVYWPLTDIETLLSVNTRFIYGSGNDPVAFTASTSELPLLLLLIDDPTTNLDSGGNAGPWGMIR